MARQEVSRGELTWIHMYEPTREDFEFLQGLHSFDEIVMDYISSPTLHPSLEEFGDNIYFILHFPVIFRTNGHNRAVEVDFLMTKNALITCTYERYEQLEKLFERCQGDEALRSKYFRSHSGYILYLVLEQLYQRMIEDRDYIEKSIDLLEQNIFSAADERLVEDISQVARDILDFRRVFKTQSSVLVLLPQALERMLGKDSIPKFTNIVVTQSRIEQLLDSHKETIDSLLATHTALVDSRTSRIVKVLTVFSAIILPLSLVTGIWGMNQRLLPLRDGDYDFWIVVAIMASIGVALMAIFRWARWI